MAILTWIYFDIKKNIKDLAKKKTYSNELVLFRTSLHQC